MKMTKEFLEGPHVMLDLETFGTKPGSVLRSIGAVRFTLQGGLLDEFYTNIDRASCEESGLAVDPDTERWWSQQSKEAQDGLLVDCRPLPEVVKSFSGWFNKSPQAYLWSQGSNFDGPLWEAACVKVSLAPPWKFFNARDTRTAYDIGGLDPRSVPRAGTYHNALDDAKHQATCVIKALMGEASCV